MKSYSYNLWETTSVCTLNEGLASNSPTCFRKSVIKAIVAYSQKGKTCYLGLVQPHTFPLIFPVWTCFFLLFSTGASTQSWRLWFCEFILSSFFPWNLFFPFFLSFSFLSVPSSTPSSSPTPLLPLVFIEHQHWLIPVIIPLGSHHSLNKNWMPERVLVTLVFWF